MKIKYRKPKTLLDLAVGSNIRYRDYEYKLVSCTVEAVKIVGRKIYIQTSADSKRLIAATDILKKHKRIMHMPSMCGGDFGSYVLTTDKKRSYKVSDWTLTKGKTLYRRHWIHGHEQLNPAVVLSRRTVRIRWSVFMPGEEHPIMADDGYGDLQQVARTACNHLKDHLLKILIR
jgi:hypothetical protein